MSDHLAPNFRMVPEEMDRPELIATVKLLRTHLDGAQRNFKLLNDRCWDALRREADLAIENDGLQRKLETLKAAL